MNRRSYDILKLIYERSNRYTLDELAKKFDVSVRTIRKDINSINEFLSNYEISEIVISNKYLKVDSDKNIYKILQRLSFYEYVLSRDERIIVILLILMYSPEFITISKVSEILYVSRSTVITDLEYLNEYLIKYNLETLGQPSTGIKLNGEEKNIRNLFIDITENEADLYKLFINTDFIEKKELDNLYKEKNMIFQNIFNEIENITGMSLSENSYQKLLRYIKFSLYRMDIGKYISNIEDKETFFMKKLFDLIVMYFKCDYNKSELSYLSNLEHKLYFTKIINTDKEVIKLQLCTRRFIEQVSNKLDLQLVGDYDLFKNLSSHLNRILLNGYTNIKNYQEIQIIVNNNLDIYKIVKEYVYFIEDYINRKLTDIELYYIVVYLCAAIDRLKHREYKSLNILLICNSGLGTSQLLKNRLLEKMDFNIVDVCSSHKINGEILDDIDLIISTVDLDVVEVPYVKVTPLIDDQDYINLKKILDNICTKDRKKTSEVDNIMNKIETSLKKYSGLSNKVRTVIVEHVKKEIIGYGIEDFLTDDFIELDVECSNWEDSIIKASKALVKNEYIDEKYIESMINNIKENGPYILISQGFALPHATISNSVNKTGFSLIRLKNSVEFGSSMLDPVKFVCVLSAKDKNTHLNALFELVNLLQINSFKKDLINAKTKREIRETILKYKKL